MTVVRAYDRLRTEGLVESRPGSGTYVTARPSLLAAVPILAEVPRRGPLNLYEPLSEAAGTVSMASSVPDPTLSPLDEILPYCFDAIYDSPWAAYYAPPSGTPEFVDGVLHLLAAEGISTRAEEVVATFGGTHARFLVLQALTSPGDGIAVESPGRLDGMGWVSQLGRRPVAIRREAGVLDLGELERALQRGVRIVFTMPTFGSTTGDVMPEAHREDLIALARRYEAWIVEDACYARLGVGMPKSPAARAPDRVITLDSFSYCVAPALRLGFVRAPLSVAGRIAAEAQLTVQSGIPPIQTAVGKWIAADGLARHLRKVLPLYRSRREAVGKALRRTMPPGTRWTEPVGGLSLWVTLPEGRYADLYDAALAKGIPFAPGTLFVAEDGERHLRLSYGRHAPEVLASAVEKLADLVRARAK